MPRMWPVSAQRRQAGEQRNAHHLEVVEQRRSKRFAAGVIHSVPEQTISLPSVRLAREHFHHLLSQTCYAAHSLVGKPRVQ